MWKLLCGDSAVESYLGYLTDAAIDLLTGKPEDNEGQWKECPWPEALGAFERKRPERHKSEGSSCVSFAPDGEGNAMSDLYTRFMEWVMPFLQANWQLFLIAVGALFLLGGIFNWKWTWDPNGHNLFGWNAFVYRHFGEKGARVNTGISGVIIILCAVAMWLLM